MNESKKTTHHTFATLRIYTQFLGRHKLGSFSIIVFMILSTIASNVPALYFKKFFDLLTTTSTTERSSIISALLRILFMIAVFEVLRWIAYEVAVFITNHVTPAITTELYNHCFAYLHRHSFTFFNNTFLGALVKRVNRFISSFDSIMDIISWSIVPFIVNAIMIMYIISRRSLWLGVILLCWIILFLAINWLMTKIKIKYDVAFSAAETAASGHLADTVSNHNAVKLFNGYRHELQAFGELLTKVKRLKQATWSMEQLFDGIQGFMMVSLEIGMFYFAIHLWADGLLTIGDFVLLQTYMLTIFLEIWGFGRIIRRIFENLANADDMTETLLTPHEIEDIPHATDLSVHEGVIEFKNSTFSYHIEPTNSSTFSNVPISSKQFENSPSVSAPASVVLTNHALETASEQNETETLEEKDPEKVTPNTPENTKNIRPLFNHLSFIIPAHQKVALVGPSGSGKSTIIKLLLRMHDLQAGDILIDQQSIRSVTQESLWAAMSLVPQDPVLFHRSILENIRYGRPEATDEEVMTAAKLAHCDEFIQRLPLGYQTEVGERGVKLSGGERQRIAIARAILRDAPILLLDEATSSLDSASEKLIQDALHTLMKHKTVIVIAHRLSTIMEMDRIIVLKHGQIIEEGSHQELLKKDGLYADLWKLQAGGFIQDNEE